MKKKEPEWKIALREAVEEAGSQSALARRMYGDDWKQRRNTITMTLRSNGISGRLARRVADATSIPLHRLRPDLWPEAEGWGKRGQQND